MIIQKADLFKDQSQETMNEITKVMVEESHEKGSLVFKAGTPANHFLYPCGWTCKSVHRNRS